MPIKPFADVCKDFWTQVEKTPGCWLWRGRTNRSGYGYFNWANKTYLAHRFSWVLARGVDGILPSSIHVCHRCDTPPCVNPTHLFTGTRRDNARDCWDKGRAAWQKSDYERPRNTSAMATHCKRGHPFTPANIYWAKAPYGPMRQCRTCKLAGSKRWYAKNRSLQAQRVRERYARLKA